MTNIADLLQQFKNPHSPFHLPPGTRGPADEGDITPNYTIPLPDLTPNPDPHPTPSHIDYSRPLESWPGTTYSAQWAENRKHILSKAAVDGWDVERGALECAVSWNHIDKFRHLNNVHYLAYFETARLAFFSTLSPVLPSSLVHDFLEGQNTGFVIKSHNIAYKAPVTHPDSLVLLTRPHQVSPASSPSSFNIELAAWSVKTGKLVSTCDTECVMYDHYAGRKAPMPENVKQALLDRMARQPPPSTGTTSKM